MTSNERFDFTNFYHNFAALAQLLSPLFVRLLAPLTENCSSDLRALFWNIVYVWFRLPVSLYLFHRFICLIKVLLVSAAFTHRVLKRTPFVLVKYLEENRYAEALIAWQNATFQKPKHLSAWTNLILLLDNLGQIDCLSLLYLK